MVTDNLKSQLTLEHRLWFFRTDKALPHYFIRPLSLLIDSIFLLRKDI